MRTSDVNTKQNENPNPPDPLGLAKPLISKKNRSNGFNETRNSHHPNPTEK